VPCLMLNLISSKSSKLVLVTFMVSQIQTSACFFLLNSIMTISWTNDDYYLHFYNLGDSTCGQRAIYSVGMTGIPIYNVNNNCATGSSALFLAKQLVSGNQANCILALGFEKMEKGSLGSAFADRTNPMDKHVESMMNNVGYAQAPPAAQFFGNAGTEHMKKYGTTTTHFAKVALKNHTHGLKNEYVVYYCFHTGCSYTCSIF